MDTEKLCAIAARLGPKFEIVADFSAIHHSKFFEKKADDVLSILKRIPCYLSDILAKHRKQLRTSIRGNHLKRYVAYRKSNKSILASPSCSRSIIIVGRVLALLKIS